MMIRSCLAVGLVAGAVSMPALAADVGVSISIGEPGFYGQIDIGDAPRPMLVYQGPTVIVAPPPGVVVEPMYLHVPPGQYKHWRRYCGRYGACGRPVYFVQDRWYNSVYVPHYRREHRDRFEHRDHGHRADRVEHHGDRFDHGNHGHRSDRGERHDRER